MTFDNYTVDNQAYSNSSAATRFLVAYQLNFPVLVGDSSSFSPTLQSNGFQGLIGLGFDTTSVVRGKLGSGAGDTPLSRIFQLNKTTQNFVSLQLNRAKDPTDTITGQITISELVSGNENVTSQTKLWLKDASLDSSNQHWAVVTDKDGVIGPDGNSIAGESIVRHISGGKLVAVLDSGFTFSQVPRKMSDAIYGRVKGATYSTQEGLWKVPCTQNLSLAFVFGGVTMPIHPLDVVNNDLDASDPNGLCNGAVSVMCSVFSLVSC